MNIKVDWDTSSIFSEYLYVRYKGYEDEQCNHIIEICTPVYPVNDGTMKKYTGEENTPVCLVCNGIVTAQKEAEYEQEAIESERDYDPTDEWRDYYNV